MDAGIICPYTIYKVYGDIRMIEQNYASMTEFMAFRKKRAPNFQGVFDGNDWGDWLALNKTPIEYIDAVYFAYTSDLMAEMAEAIGKNADAEKYKTWGKQVRRFFNRNYVNDNGSLAVNTQTAYSLALSVDMLPPAKRDLAAQHLVRLVEDNDNLMATGFIGSRPLLPVLTATGNHDLAVRLLQNRRYPSWGYSVVNGAKTIWERWNSYTKEGGFGDAKMNSFNQYAFGAVCEWMFQSLVGINTDGAGYGHIVLRPGPPGADSNPDHDPIHWVKAEYDSIRGKIAVDWKQDSRSFEYKVTIPANTSATLYLPASSADKVTESGNRLNGVNLGGMEGARVKLALDSGTYHFIARN
jgi:alpha-L-rhamnosidase